MNNAALLSSKREIITVTLNPAIDQTISLSQLIPGALNLAHEMHCNPGGKGVNVACCLADFGERVSVTGLLGADNSESFVEMFRHKGINDRFLRAPGSTRINIKLSDRSRNETTDINLPGIQVDAGMLDAVLWQFDALDAPVHVVLAGSLPVGLPQASYAHLIWQLKRRGACVLLDTSGAALEAALDVPAAAMPHCVKPNRQELEQLVGQALPTLELVTAAARELQRLGIERVVVSLGEQGALFTDAEQCLLASLPVMNAVSTVGAGDALVAGMVSAWNAGLDSEAIARRAVAFAAAKLTSIGPHLPDSCNISALVSRVTIRQL